MLSVIAYAAAQSPQTQGQQSPSLLASPLPMMLIIFGIFYFLVIRPQQKKQKEHQNMLKDLKKNDEVITTGGIHGTIVNVKENTFVVRVNDNVRLEVSKSAIAGLKKKTQGE